MDQGGWVSVAVVDLQPFNTGMLKHFGLVAVTG